jgi:hypothetical protein
LYYPLSPLGKRETKKSKRAVLQNLVKMACRNPFKTCRRKAKSKFRESIDSNIKSSGSDEEEKTPEKFEIKKD